MTKQQDPEEQRYRAFEKGFCETGGSVARELAKNTTGAFFSEYTRFNDPAQNPREIGRRVGAVFNSGTLYGARNMQRAIKKMLTEAKAADPHAYHIINLRAIEELVK